MTEIAPSLIGIAEPTIVTADFGGTYSTILEGERLMQPGTKILRYETPKSYDQAIEQIGMRTAALLGRKRLDGFGFGAAGKIVDGVVKTAGQLAEYGWVGRDVTNDIAAALGIDSAFVVGLNDVEAAAKAEQTARKAEQDGPEGIFTLSTGFGGAIYTQEKIITDEPGHKFLEYGVQCGCGNNGCIEAHISGSGIKRKYGTAAEDIPANDSRWVLIKKDVIAALDLTLSRYGIEGHTLKRLSFYGSVALKGPEMLAAITEGMADTFIEAPEVAPATYGENSGLFGAYYAVRERIAAN